MAIFNFGPAVFSDRMKQYGIDIEYCALIFAVPLISPLFASVVVWQLTKYLEYRLIVLLSFLFIFLAFVLIGPSQYFLIPEELWIMAVGMATLGFAAFLSIIPLFPEITDIVKQEHGHDINASYLFDKVSSLYNAALGTGNIFGPALGAQLTYNFGFRTCTDILAVASLVIFVCYFLIADGSQAIKMALKGGSKITHVQIELQQREEFPLERSFEIAAFHDFQQIPSSRKSTIEEESVEGSATTKSSPGKDYLC